MQISSKFQPKSNSSFIRKEKAWGRDNIKMDNG